MRDRALSLLIPTSPPLVLGIAVVVALIVAVAAVAESRATGLMSGAGRPISQR
jgi:xanthine dehydrogenase molybdopterin-binding subunit B